MSTPAFDTSFARSSVGLARKATRSAVSLGVRQLVVQAANVVGGLVLARILPPAEFGVFGVTTFILNFLVVFGDVGLAASLVRHQSSPSSRDFDAVFTAQQLLAATVALLLWLVSERIASGYGLPRDGRWLFRLVGLSLAISSFQTAARARLERELAFDRLAFVDIAQAVVFNGAAIALAWANVGVLSFGIALVLRSITTSLLVNRILPSRLKWVIDIRRIREHMAFGLPYQGAQLVNLGKDTLTPVFVGLVLGPDAVGYINWANMVTYFPVFAVAILQRLYLPLFAKLASRPDQLADALRLVLSLVTAAVYAASAVILVYRNGVVLGVFGSKWAPATTLFPALIAVNILLTPTIICLSVMNALGHAKTVFYFFVVWAGLTWTLGPLAIVSLGWPGWGWATLGVNSANLWMLHKVSRLTGVAVFRIVRRSLIAATIAGLLAWANSKIPNVFASLVATTGTTLGVLGVLNFRTIRSALRALKVMPADS